LEDFRPGVPRVGRIPSRGWKKRTSVFQTLEKIRRKLPRVGRNRSKGWKKAELFFQTLEKYTLPPAGEAEGRWGSP
jgi:hypothetical protein